ncbi:MAG: hypothetical protein ACRD30_02520 [Bryobacteraceae bacterium]
MELPKLDLPKLPEKDLVPIHATMESETQWPSGSRSSSAQYFRDEKGRTRIEHGDLASIHDPVAGKSFILHKPNKIALPGAPKIPEFHLPDKPEMPKLPGHEMPQAPHPEDLGEKTIEGFKATGKKFSFPQPGKPQPLTHELWHSKDLQLPLHSTVTDPSTKTITSMRMKQISPGAKLDPAMFQVPHDFKSIVPKPKI